ncbi:hypothetical protein GCM10027049_26730 [Mucilaginibacter puniceus]
MKSKPPKLDATQQEYLVHFCSTYPLINVKTELLKWLVLTVKAKGEAGTYVQTEEFRNFYDDLTNMITAVYWVHYKSKK